MNHLRITTAELAKLCDVSQGTVDRALNGRAGISPATREKILKTAHNYGWRPAIGNSKDKNHVPTVGIVVFDLNNEFFSKLITDLEMIARSRGILTTVLFTHYDSAGEIECLRWLDSCGVDAVILCSVNGGKIFDHFLSEFHIPIIAIGNQTGNIPYVGIDDFSAMKDAAEYLFASYQTVIYYSPALRYPNAFAQKKRFEGFMAAVKGDTHYSIITSKENFLQNYSENTAILCSTDYYAMQVHSILPHVKVMGFDNLNILDRLSLPIDSVDYDTALIAREAFSLIESKEKRDIIIPHSIVKR